MSWVDIAAAISAARHTRMHVVTASIDALNFVSPIYGGWAVTLLAAVNYVGRTSMEIGVRVEGEDLLRGVCVHTASAYLTFVALDKDGVPSVVPQLELITEEQKRRHKAAMARRKART